MLFNSQTFILLFFPIVLLAFFLAGRWRQSWAAGALGGASLVFYVSGNPLWHSAILILSIIFNYTIGWGLGKRGYDISARRIVLIFGVCANLATIAYFKYSKLLLSVFGFSIDDVVIPLGISFFTFTQIAYLVDCYRGATKERNPIHYMLFVIYFPHLIAGPILHHKEMIPQFGCSEIYRPRWDTLALGISVFVVGLLKKIVLADPFAPFANDVFNSASSSHPAAFSAWAGVLAYTLQIYFDFSGYSDMAIGLSYAIGVRLPLNFNSPYKAQSIIDFWRRWHMTLGRFLRDYLYFPLGGNQKGPVLRHVNLLVTMLLAGLWHGAGWTFVIWGGLHGIYLIINHFWNEYFTPLPRFLAWPVTFIAVVIAWVFFRSDNLIAAQAMLSGMIGLNGFMSNGLQSLQMMVVLPLIATGLALVIAAPNTQQIFGRWNVALEPAASPIYIGWKPSFGWSICLGAALGGAIFIVSGNSPFLYFRF